MKEHKTRVGGQAVLEGVMMRGPLGTCTAVRKPDGEIATNFTTKGSVNKKSPLQKIPVVRGVVNFVSTMVIGIKALMYSYEFIDLEEEENPSKFEQMLKDRFGDKLKDVIIYLALILSLGFSVGLFILLPTVLVGFLGDVVSNPVIKTLIEGVVRIILFVVYLVLVSKTNDIKIVYQYHGAEHKTIFAYENNEELTPEKVMKYPRLHPRCGTSFLILVMIISILAFSFLRWEGVIMRMVTRLALLPVVAGISYEVIKWAGNSQNLLVRIISYPGMMLQKLTTQEPTAQQIEVAITALQKVVTGNKEDDTW